MFSDQDLARFRQEIVDMDVPYDYPFQISTGRLKLILARLDAAERVVDEIRWRTEEPPAVNKLVRAWRTTAGK